jgi:SAM-dependent methyltransferase
VHDGNLPLHQRRLNGALLLHQAAMPELVFDRRLLHDHLVRAANGTPAEFLLQRVAQDLSERLAAVLRRFRWAADIGTPGRALCRELLRSGKVENMIATGAAVSVLQGWYATDHLWPRPFFVVADEEALPLRDHSLDLIVSGLAMQFVNDLPGTLTQACRALKPDGLLLAALAGGDTLMELRQSFATAETEIEGGVSPRVIPFVDVRVAGSLLQRAGFAMPVTDIDRFTVRYESPLALMHDLRAMGATNPMIERSRCPLKRATLARMMEVYGERFSDPDGRLRATFEIVWLSGWAPQRGGRMTGDG